MGLLAGLPTFISPPGPFIGSAPAGRCPNPTPCGKCALQAFLRPVSGLLRRRRGDFAQSRAFSDHYQPTEATVTLQNPDGEKSLLQLINFHPTADQPHFLGVYDPENPDALRLQLLKKEPTTGAVYGFENRVVTFVYDPDNPGVAELYRSGWWDKIPAENDDSLSSFLSQLPDKTSSLNYNEDIPFAVEVLSAKNTNEEVSSAVFAGAGFLSESERKKYLETFFQNNSLGLLKVRKPNNLGYLSIPVVIPNTTDVDPIALSQTVTQRIPEAKIRNLGYRLNKNAGEQIKFVYINDINDRIYAAGTTGELYDITDNLAQKITPPTLAFRSSFGFFVDENGKIVATDRWGFYQSAEFNPEDKDNTWNEFDEDQWRQLATPEQQNEVTTKTIQEILNALKIAPDQVQIITDENGVARFAVVTRRRFCLPDAKLYIDNLTKYLWLVKWVNEEGVRILIIQDPADTYIVKRQGLAATLAKFNNTNPP